jgi:hypothetical protein
VVGPAILGFAVAVAFWPGLMSAAVVPRWSLIAVGLPMVSWLDPRRLSDAGLILLGLYAGYAALSLAWAPDPITGTNDLFRILVFVGAVLAGACFEDISPILRAVAWGVAISALIALIQLTGWSPVSQAESPAGLFYNRDVLAETAAILFVWALFSRQIVLASLLAVPLLVCGSRVALACVVLGIAAVRPRVALIGVLVIGLGIVVFTIWHPAKLNSGFVRLEIWHATLVGVTAIGNGLGSFAVAYPIPEHAHSDILQSFYELGIGATPLLALLLLATWKMASEPIGAAMACLFGEYAVAFPLHLPLTTFLAGLLVGNLVRRRDTVRVGGYVGRAHVEVHN